MPITSVDEVIEVSETVDLAGLYNFDAIEELLKKVLKVLKFAPVCEPSASIDVGGSVAVSRLCCTPEQGGSIVKMTVSGSLSAAAGIECDIPLPPFPVLKVRVLGSAGLEASLSFATECEGLQFCFTVQGTAEAGIGLAIGDDDIIGASVVGIGTIAFPPVNVCLPPVQIEVPGEFCFSLEVVGSVTAMSFMTVSVGYTFIDDKCLVLW